MGGPAAFATVSRAQKGRPGEHSQHRVHPSAQLVGLEAIDLTLGDQPPDHLDRAHERGQVGGDRVRASYPFQYSARDHGPAVDQAHRLERPGPVAAGARRHGVLENCVDLAQLAAHQEPPLQPAPRLGPDWDVAIGLQGDVDEAAELRLGESDGGPVEGWLGRVIGRG
jgi:hypothetical protein